MKSHEVMQFAIDRIGVKALAARLNLSTAMVYKWCQESPQEDPTSSGARNPLDRIREIYVATQDPRLINWLCHEAGGFFVQNPEVPPATADAQLLATTHRVVDEFGQMLTAVSSSVENDGRISRDEADRIRQCWENLKTTAERFVIACERGLYGGRNAIR